MSSNLSLKKAINQKKFTVTLHTNCMSYTSKKSKSWFEIKKKKKLCNMFPPKWRISAINFIRLHKFKESEKLFMLSAFNSNNVCIVCSFFFLLFFQKATYPSFHLQHTMHLFFLPFRITRIEIRWWILLR